MPEQKERHFLEAILEGGEALLDLATDNEAVKAVPVVGTAIKLLKGVDDFRSRALAAKLSRFLSDPALQSESARRKLREGLSASAEDAQKIGESLFLVLDRMIDLEKPGLLAKIFVAYLDGIISSVELRRLAHAMDSAFTDDLIALQGWQESSHAKYGTEWKLPLAGAGLTRVVTGQTWDDMNEVYYELTELGRALHRALSHSSQSSLSNLYKLERGLDPVSRS